MPTVVRRAFTLIELLVVIAIIALLVSILLPALASARDLAKSAICSSNIKQFMIATLNYATDNRELLSGYKPPEPINGQYVLVQYNGDGVAPTVASFGNETAWMSNRGYDLIRRLSAPANLSIASVDNWLPQINYSHLPLIEYMAKRLPEPIVCCPNDAKRKSWQENPLQPVAGTPRGPYSASYSYSVHATFLDKDGTGAGQALRQTVDQGTFQGITAGGSWPASRRRVSEINFPGRKVAWVEAYQRHALKRSAIPAYFMNDAAKPMTAFFDSSVRLVNSADCVSGTYNLSVGIKIPTAGLLYDRAGGLEDEPWTNGNDTYSGPQQRGQIRWTPDGLKGWDIVSAK